MVLPLGVTLAEQVPALVQPHLEVGKPLVLLVAGDLPRAQPLAEVVLLLDECGDLMVQRDVLSHAESLTDHGDTARRLLRS